MTSFDEAFTCERRAWRTGHHGRDDGLPVKGELGQRYCWAWEEAAETLKELWNFYSRCMPPRGYGDEFLGASPVMVMRGGAP